MGKYITLKGRADGIEVIIDPLADFDEVLDEIERVFDDEGRFFTDAGVNLILSGKTLSEAQRAIVSHKIWNAVGEGAYITSERSRHEEKTDFHRGIVRNGKKLKSRGNMVVFGDVNPGAELLAGGSIVVLGTLRGVAHAGCGGNTSAVVAALCMQPSQLRIADIYSRAPESGEKKVNMPEVASISGDGIIIEVISK